MDSLARTNAATSRLVAALAAFALHVCFGYALQRMRSPQPSAATALETYLVWIRIDRADLPDIQPERVREETLLRPEGARSHDVRTPVESSAELDARTSTARSAKVDWRAHAVRSAQVVVADTLEQRYRQFGPGQDRSPGEPQVPSIFGTGPAHKLGDIEGDPREQIVWLNNRCFMELERPVQTARDWIVSNPGSFAPLLTKCLLPFGGSGPNGKLFEHMRKPAEAAVPKLGTKIRELPGEEPE